MVGAQIGARECSDDIALKDGECTRERVAQLLPPLTESRLHESPEALFIVRAQAKCVVARSMLEQQDGGINARHWIKRLSRNPRNDGGCRSRLHKCREVGPVTRRGCYSLRNLQLHE